MGETKGFHLSSTTKEKRGLTAPFLFIFFSPYNDNDNFLIKKGESLC